MKGAPSSEHWKVEPDSLEVKLKLGAVELEGFDGDAVMVVSGAVRSIVQVKLAGVASVLPAVSVARTWKVCEPLTRSLYCLGEVQAAKAALSKLQVKVEPVSLDENVNVAELLLTVPEGPEAIIVSGAVRSTSTVRALEVAEVLPAASVAVAV